MSVIKSTKIKKNKDEIPENFRNMHALYGRYETVEDEFNSWLFKGSSVSYCISHKGQQINQPWCSGCFSDTADIGPLHTADVMIVFTSPYNNTAAELDAELDLKPYTDDIYGYLSRLADAVGLSISDWYFTPLIKFLMPFGVDKTIPTEWKHECYPWLLAEIRRVQPKYILCVGSNPLKEILGSSTKLESSYGHIISNTFSYSDGLQLTTKIVALPAISSSSEEAREEVEPRVLKQLSVMTWDMNPSVKREAISTRHIVCRTADEVKSEVDRVIAANQNIVAVDLEWEGKTPFEEGAHVLTFQFSTELGEGIVCVLSDHDGRNEEYFQILEQLKRLITAHDDWKPRLGGHFLRADLPWILSLFSDEDKLKIMDSYAPAETAEKCRTEGGWDTSLMLHAYNEDMPSYGLKYCAETLLDMDEWDNDLVKSIEDFIADNKKRSTDLAAMISGKGKRIKGLKTEDYTVDSFDCMSNKDEQTLEDLEEERDSLVLKKSDLKGFGCVPDTILHEYAAWDADATFRLAYLCMYGLDGKKALLDSDAYHHANWEPYWRAHSASLPLLEMERTGFVLDEYRLEQLGFLFQLVYEMLLTNFRNEKVFWNEFNPQSTRHKAGYLFGRKYTKAETAGGVVKYAMPDGAYSLELSPLYATSSKTNWEALGVDQDYSTPASDSLTLAILAQENEDVRMLYDICKLGNTLKGNIRPPVIRQRKDGSKYYTYEDGIYTYMYPDGTVHTHLKQLLKTGRLSSTEPNFQNISKSAEALIQRILGTEEEESPYAYVYCGDERVKYLYPMRTILKAQEGRVLIESDFTGAELAVMAWISGDPTMIEHVRRNALPESDPDFYDIHSNIAVKAFRLNCPPTKKGLASIGKKHLRVAAKAVVFGIPYGRSAGSIVQQLRGQGVKLTKEEGEALVESYFSMYPQTKDYISKCKSDVTELGYVVSPFNRYRRFPNYKRMYAKRLGVPYCNLTDYLYEHKDEEHLDYDAYCKYYDDKTKCTHNRNRDFDLYVASHRLLQSDISKYGREACNAPIQSTVADAVNNALRNIWNYRKLHPELDFKLHMQIHDALVISVPMDQVEAGVAMMQECMVDNNPVFIYDPLRKENVEHHFSIDSDLYYHWGESISLERVHEDLKNFAKK